LRSYISPAAWKHFLSLPISIRLTSEENNDIRNRNIHVAKRLLEYFVANAHVHYGKAFSVYNVHELFHLTDNVEYYQAPLINFSCFQFENHLQFLKRSLRGKSKLLSQVTKRSEELDGNYFLRKERHCTMSVRILASCQSLHSSLLIKLKTMKHFYVIYIRKTNLTAFLCL